MIGFITMICESHLKYAERKDLRIVYGFDAERFEMDFIPSYMVRIVQNLLSNAIKFSYPGSDILVSAKIVDADDGKALQLYVCDTGIGKPQLNRKIKAIRDTPPSNTSFRSGYPWPCIYSPRRIIPSETSPRGSESTMWPTLSRSSGK